LKYCCVCRKELIEDYQKVCDKCFRVYHQEQSHQNLRELLESETLFEEEPEKETKPIKKYAGGRWY
jgi:hypothetical protein